MRKIKSLLLIINKKEKKILYFLIFLMILAALLETVSIGLVIPAISILINGAESFHNIIFLKTFENFLQKMSDKELAIFLFSSLFFIFLLKTIFLIFLHHTQFKFSSSMLLRITADLFKKIIAQPYSIFFQKNRISRVRSVDIYFFSF